MIWLSGWMAPWNGSLQRVHQPLFFFKYGWLPRWLQSSCMKYYRWLKFYVICRWLGDFSFWRVTMMASCKIANVYIVATTALNVIKIYWQRVYCHKYIFGDGVIAKQQEIFVPYKQYVATKRLQILHKDILSDTDKSNYKDRRCPKKCKT